MPQPGEQHADIAASIYDALTPFVRAHRLGKVRFDVGYLIRQNPDRVVSPDVSWIRDERLPADRDRRRFIPGPPDLAVEVTSPNDIDRDTEAKVVEYLRAGAGRVWLVRPNVGSVTVYRGDGSATVLRAHADILTSADAGFDIDGFALTLRDVFGG